MMMEFCLEDYHSDENNATGSKDDDDDDDDEIPDKKDEVVQRLGVHPSLAKQLLDGAALDGSSVAAD